MNFLSGVEQPQTTASARTRQPLSRQKECEQNLDLGGPGKPATQAAEAGTPNDVSRLTEQVGWKMQVGTWRMKTLPHTAHFAKARAGRDSGEKGAETPGRRRLVQRLIPLLLLRQLRLRLLL